MEGASPQPAMLRLLSRLLRAVVGVVALVIAFAIFAFLVSTAPEPERTGDHGRALVVRAVELKRVDVPRVWDGYGTARAMRAVDVSAEITGVVSMRPPEIEAGRAVTLGQTIIQLDPEDYEQQLEAQNQLVASLEAELDALEARAKRLAERVELASEEVELADKQYGRTVDSRTKGGANDNEVEDALAALRRAERVATLLAQELETIPAERAGLNARLANQKARVRLAERDLDRTTITAPLAGLLQMIDARVGERLSPGHVIARIVDLERIEIPIRVPVSAGASIVIGDRVELRADSSLEAEWEGTVVGIAPEADPASRSMTVFIEVEQQLDQAVRERRAINEQGGRLLLPGQFVVARVITSTSTPRIVVPRTAVERDRVMVAHQTSGQRAAGVPVRVLFHLDGSYPEIDPTESQWAVLEGSPELDEGTIVITSNLDEVVDGTPVQAIPGALEGE